MRSLTLVFAGLALVGGVVSVNLWRELRAEREMTTQLRLEVGELRASASSLPAGGAGQPRAAIPGIPQSAAPTAPPTQAAAANAEGPQFRPVTALPLALNRSELLKDPEYRKAALAQERLNLPQRYPGLAEELGLGADEADRLFDLMAENQLELNATMTAIPTGANGAVDIAAVEEVNRKRQEVLREQEEEMQALLGSNRYAQWKEYEQTLPARQQVVQLGRTLESAGVPLSSDQSRPLIAAYTAERKRQAEEFRRLLGSGPTSPADQQRLMEERFRLQADSNRRLVDAARSHLNARQVEALQASLEQQLTLNRATNRILEIQRQAQGANAAPATAVQGTVVF